MNAFASPRLTLVTDRRLCPDGGLADTVAEAVAGGVDAVQLREKDLGCRDLLRLARTLRAVTAGRALLFVNGPAGLARAAGADGVQLSEDGQSIAVARRRGGAGLIAARSVHSVEGARAAEQDGADMLVLGTIFPSRSHPGGATGGLDLVRQVTRAVRIPVIGIGGIVADNAAGVIAAGASGVAVISSILAAAAPRQAAERLRAVVDTAIAGAPLVEAEQRT
jgi:thiamine-phosphate pyrophosphorylase